MAMRVYQTKLVEKARDAVAKGHRRVLIQLPTGGGKTHILSDIARAASLKNSPIMAMAHRIEIVQQISDRLTMFGLLPSIVASGVPFSSSPTFTTAAMQQTLVRRLDKVDQPAILIVDEAHHQPAAGYQKIVEAWPGTIVIGLTATPCRLDGKPLKDYFDVLICGPTVRDLIDMGSLADFTYLAPPVDPKLQEDLKKIRKTGGDYQKGQLETAVSTKKIIGDVVDHYRSTFNGKPVIAFCVSVDHAKQISSAFNAVGFRAESVDGNMKKEERDAHMTAFRNGSISVLASCDLIGEGYDAPDCAGVLLLRPTASLTIFLQQVGRALRPKEDGSKAIILDHVGNCYRHGRPDDEREWSLESKVKPQNVQIKQCPKCYAIIDPVKMDLSAGCPSGAYPDDCAYLEVKDEAGEKEVTIEYVDGKLVEFIKPVKADWAGDLDVRQATGQDYQRLLRAAGDDEGRLQQIAKARNYKKGWVHVRLEQIRAMKGRRKY